MTGPTLPCGVRSQKSKNKEVPCPCSCVAARPSLWGTISTLDDLCVRGPRLGEVLRGKMIDENR